LPEPFLKVPRTWKEVHATEAVKKRHGEAGIKRPKEGVQLRIEVGQRVGQFKGGRE